MLDYISRDYTAAVQNGKVINDGEYAEMLEFSDKVIELIKNSELNENEKANILAELKKMKGLIDRKAPHENITTVAGKSRQDIIEAAGFKTAPLTWPNLKNGETLYVQNCTPCHGVRGAGDGKLAAGLVPAPTNFLNDTLMQETLPFAIGLSRKAKGIIKQNLWVSLGIVGILIPLTISGIATIGPAVLIHEGSTLVVVFNALRLLAYKK